tara:strand:+ start:23536 stop:24630 length:1095 start_codon:yes stop_codon:yes gene_type:complete
MFRIRKLNTSHYQQMIHIMVTSPMKTPFIEVLFDKGPDISLINEVWSNKYNYYGVFSHNLLVGFGSRLEYDGYLNKGKCSFSYLGNFCIHPDYRQKGLFKKLVEFILEEAIQTENICFSIVLKGNAPVERYFSNKRYQFQGLLNFKVLDTYVTQSILITKRRKTSDDYQIQKATEHHKTQIINLLVSEFKRKNFAPIITKKTFENKINGTYNIHLNDYILAFKDSRIVGICGVWKMQKLKRTKIVRYKSWFQLMLIYYKLLSKIFKYPRLPQSGETLKEVYLTDLFVEENNPAILQAMLFNINNELKTKNYNLIHFAMSKTNPLLKATKPFFAVSTYSNIYATSKNLKLLSNEDGHPYIDIALI